MLSWAEKILTSKSTYQGILQHGQKSVIPLQKVKIMVDLGVRFDRNFTFRDHISEKSNKAYSVIGNIKKIIYIYGRTQFYVTL